MNSREKAQNAQNTCFFAAMPDFSLCSQSCGLLSKFVFTHTNISDESPEWQAFAMPEGARASCLFAVNADNADGTL
jgi:hypothetical protein